MAARNIFLSKISSNRGAGEGNLFTLIFMVCLVLLLLLQLKYCSPTPPPAAVKPTEKAVAPLAFDPVLFDSGKATLKPPAMEQLKKIAESMKTNPQIKLKIEGYTDSVYSEEFNVKLSRQRAEDVMNELVKLGVDARRLEAAWYGEKQPIADNATEEGKAKNRRVSFKVIGP